MFKKVLASLLAVSLLIGGTISATAEDESQVLSLTEQMAEFESTIPLDFRMEMERQTEAIENYQNLLSTFPKNNCGEITYPDEYAGAYIEDATLIICLTDNTAEMQSKYIGLCRNDNKVAFTEKEYSMNELISYTSYAIEMMEEGKNVVRVGITQKDNLLNIA